MELKSLMSGIAIVIDDKLENASINEKDQDGNGDRIVEIVERIGQEWDLPFFKSSEMPSERMWDNLLQAASFILLDWQLWPTGAPHLEEVGIEKNVQFLERAKHYFVPVFIFTNESVDDVEEKLPETLYQKGVPEKNFVFIRQKIDLMIENFFDFNAIENWIRQNASVYILKTWEHAFHIAKKELFGSMYARSPDWPKVLWKAYNDDEVDPGSSLMNLINDNLRGRMRTGVFETAIFADPPFDVPQEDIQALIGEASFQPNASLPGDEIGCGDMFRLTQGKFLLNLRPDCDCVPRDGESDAVELYCVEGKRIGNAELARIFHQGHFPERPWESIAFCIYERRSIRFNFRKLRVKRFSDLRGQRVGRLLHPYVTRMQQRYALYLQRQGLPRIPEEAVVDRLHPETS